MIPHPLVGDVGTLENDDAIKRSLLNLLKSEPFDIPNEANTLDLNGLLFITRDHIVDGEIRTRIEHTVHKHEPRVKVLDVELSSTNPRNLLINIKYKIIDLDMEDQITYAIQRTN